MLRASLRVAEGGYDRVTENGNGRRREHEYTKRVSAHGRSAGHSWMAWPGCGWDAGKLGGWNWDGKEAITYLETDW